MKNSQKGFTLIELLVVIAIIGILSSVVLASLTTARSKGSDAAIKSQLSNMRAQAELYYSNNNNKYQVGTDMNATTPWTSATKGLADSSIDSLLMGTGTGGLGNLAAGIKNAGGVTIKFLVKSDAWAVSSTLSDSTTWCVDSAGKSASSTISLSTFNCI
jgi:prepilin-type N-terminal cleavage/methylation domain-containing protein